MPDGSSPSKRQLTKTLEVPVRTATTPRPRFSICRAALVTDGRHNINPATTAGMIVWLNHMRLFFFMLWLFVWFVPSGELGKVSILLRDCLRAILQRRQAHCVFEGDKKTVQLFETTHFGDGRRFVIRSGKQFQGACNPEPAQLLSGAAPVVLRKSLVESAARHACHFGQIGDADGLMPMPGQKAQAHRYALMFDCNRSQSVTKLFHLGVFGRAAIILHWNQGPFNCAICRASPGSKSEVSCQK